MTFTKLSVLIPTRHRTVMLQSLLLSYQHTVVDHSSVELVFRVDEDDLESQAFLADTHWRVLVGPRLQGYESLPVFFNEMLREMTGDVLMCGNDDMLFLTKDWNTLILQAANRYTDGLFNLGVVTFNETHFPFSIISKAAADAMGYVHHPAIFWGDIFLRDVMAAFGRSVLLNTVAIDHNWMGHRPDEVFVEANQSAYLQRDPHYWEKHSHLVADSVAKLRGLRERAA